MLVRSDAHGTLLIGQQSHAWISGQLARAWGNQRFGPPDPWEEVCLAAEQHDIGMSEWDLAPSRNPESGLPRSFMEMPIDIHLELWRSAPRRLERQSRYAALLTSMHGTRLYASRDLGRLPPDDADAVRGYLAEQRDLQARLAGSLRADPATADAATESNVERNSRLIWTWDYLSLAVCLDWAPCSVSGVPGGAAPIELKLDAGDRPRQVVLDPWPFHRSEPLTVRCDAQRLTGRFDDDAALEAALSEAPWETFEVMISPTSSV
jgi:hypothetical protein